MRKARVSLKNNPEFASVSDQKLRQCLDSIQTLLFAYHPTNGFKSEHEMLSKMWKQISDEVLDRDDYETPSQDLIEEPVSNVKVEKNKNEVLQSTEARQTPKSIKQFKQFKIIRKG